MAGPIFMADGSTSVRTRGATLNQGYRMRLMRKLLLSVVLALPAAAEAQSLLDRSPNVSGDWVGAPGTLYFHFVHRFTASQAPQRKVSNVPTFLLAAGLPRRLLAGFNYSTNSTLAPNFPNEWELFARWAPLGEDYGAPLDVGVRAGYNNAADGIDGEVSVAKRFGIARLIVAGRVLSDPLEARNTRFAVASGATIRLGQYVALAGDVASLTDRDSTERVAWSAGLHIAIPLTPHTLSLHATNAPVATLQGASRGSSSVRYGFEFTIPLTLRRYFGKRAQDFSDTTVSATAALVDTVRTVIKNISYLQPRLNIAVGTTIEWRNSDPLPHSVSAVDKSFNSGLIQPGKTYRHTFTKAGTYNFYCMPHPFMKGVVVVTDQ